MDHLVIIRFSVKLQGGFQKIYNNLFDEDRMDKRFYYFENFCYKTLSNQSTNDFKVIIIVDKELPTKYLTKLNNIIDKPNFIIHVWNPETDDIYYTTWLQQYINKKKLYLITTRLDDDDGVNYYFIQNVQHEAMKRQIKARKGLVMAISLYTGFFLLHHNDQFYIKSKKVRCTGAGLTLITKNGSEKYVYSYDHSLIHKVLPCKYINIYPQMFMILNHNYGDSKRFTTEDINSYNEIELDHIYNLLNFNA